MEGVKLVSWVCGFSSWKIDLASAAFGDVWHLFTIENPAAVVTTCFAIWKWWEVRETNVFNRSASLLG